ncbi:hypothetical protein ABPG72_017390 [Tetrahymena utriculariae]
MSQSSRPDQLRQNIDFNSVLLVGFDQIDQAEEGEQNLSVWNDQLQNYNKVVDCFNKQTQERNYMGNSHLNNGAQIAAKNRMNSGSKQHENIRRSKQNQSQIHLNQPILLNSVQQNFPMSMQMAQTSSSQQHQLQQQNSGTNLQNYYQNQTATKSFNPSSTTSATPSQAILNSTARGFMLHAKSKKINSVQPNKNILSGLNEASALNQNVSENLVNVGKNQQQQSQQLQQLQQGQQQQQNQQQSQQQQQQYMNENNFFQIFGDQSKIKALIQQQSQQQQQLQQQVATNTQINQNNSVFFQNKRPKQSDSTFDSTCSSTLVQESSYITPRNTNKSLQNSFIQQGNQQNSQILNFNEMGGSCTPQQQQTTQFNNNQNNQQGVYRNRNSISTHQAYQNSSSNSTTNNSISNNNNNNNNNSVMYYDSKIARQLSQLSVSDYSQQQQSQQQNTATTTPRGGNNNYSMILLHYPSHYVQGQNNFYSHHHRHLSFSNNSSSQQHSFILSQLQQSHVNQHSYSSNSNNQSFQGSQAYHAQPEIMFSPMIHNKSNDSISQNNCHLSSINSLNTSFQQNYTSQCQIDDQNKSSTYKSDSLHILQQQQQQQSYNDSSLQNGQMILPQTSQQNQSQFYSKNSSQKNPQVNHPQFSPIIQQGNQGQQNSNIQQQQNQTNSLLHYPQKFLAKPQGIHRKNLSTSSKTNCGSQIYSNITILNNQKFDSASFQQSSQQIQQNDNSTQNSGNINQNSASVKQKSETTSQVAFSQLSRKVRSITNNMIEQSQILEEDDDKFDGELLDDSNNESENDKKQKSDDQTKGSKKAEKKNSKGTRKRKIIAQEEESNYLINPENVKQDGRTTVMIKNIPNKYSLQALMEKIDQNHSKTYDFFYLPIDFRNKCNVGYAFINFIDPEFIKQFYEEFHNQKWAKFNSEKVCLLYYARLQGRNALIHHFQHSSVMNQKDKKLKPVILPKNEVIALEQLLKNQREEVRKASNSSSSVDQRSQSPENIKSQISSNEQDNQANTPKQQQYEKSQSKESIKSRGSNHNSSNHTLKDEKGITTQSSDSQNIQTRSSSIKSSLLLNQNLNISSISNSISPTNHEDIKQKQTQLAKSSTKK